MEPNKIEQDFKQKLEQRTIEPAAMAWDRLDAMLSVTEKRKQPKRRTWMYIAASFLGFLLVGAFLLNQEKQATGNTGIDAGNAVVNSERVKPVSSGDNEMTGNDVTVNGINTAPVSTEAVAMEGDVTYPVTKAAGKGSKEAVAIQVNNTIAVDKSHNTINKDEAVAAQVDVQLAPARETEKLLEASLPETNARKKSTVKVDVNSLLSSVEGELEDNFRSKVLQGVVKNYNTVKTSVANRNFQ